MANPFYNEFARGGEGHLEVGKNVYYTKNHLCHMVLALKPFGCMPSSQSDGVQSAVANHFKEMIFLPIETSGEGEINAHSRVQMALGEAKVKARMEFDQALKSTGKRLEDIKEYVAEHPELRNLFYPVPHVHGYAGVAANFVLHVNDLMNGKKRLARVPATPPQQAGRQPPRSATSGRLILSVERLRRGRKVTRPMPEVQVPEGTQAAPTYRLDVQLHELLMKPPEQPRLLPPPPNGKEQKLPTPVFPQHPELMSARGRGLLPQDQRTPQVQAKHIYRAAQGMGVPVLPLARSCRASFIPSSPTCSTSGSATSTATTAGRSTTAFAA